MTDAVRPLAAKDDDDFDELGDLLAEAGRRRPSFAGAYEDASLRQSVLTQLIKIRKELGISQKQVAKRMQTTQSAISDLERGVGDFHLSTLQRYARAVTARIRLSVDLPHDSPWYGEWFYDRSAGATRIDQGRRPTPAAPYAQRWHSSTPAAPVPHLNESRTSYILAL
jgi:transcriptional regulator with XRE-family HTH domain